MKRKILAVLISTLAVVFTGCASVHSDTNDKEVGKIETEESKTGNAKASVVRFGDQADYYTTKVAIKKGFLREEFGDEYEFQLATFANGPAATEAFVSGQIDFAEYGDTPAVQAFANGTDVRIISTLWLSDDAYALIAGENSGIDSLGDLKGKRLGYSAGTNGHKLLLKILQSQNLTENDVTLVNLSAAESQAALVKGDVDTILGSQPNIETIVQETGGKVITTNKDFETAAVFILADNSFSNANADIVARILKVFDGTNKWIAENQEEAAQIVADYNGKDIESVKKYYETRDWEITWNQQIQDTVSDTIQFSYDLGNISELFDINELVDTAYLKKAGLIE